MNITASRRVRRWALIVLLPLWWFTACTPQPDEKLSLLSEARASFAAHEYVAAKLKLHKYLALDETNYEVFYLLGEIAEKQGDNPLALHFYGRVVALKDDHIEARIKAARLFLVGGDVNQAEGILKFVRDFRPNDTQLSVLEAAIAEMKGQRDDALTKAQAVYGAHPESVENALLLNELYSKRGYIEKGEEVLRSNIAAVGKNAEVVFALAANLVRQRRYDEAETMLLELVEAEPDVLPYQTGLAELYVGLGRLDAAERVLRSAVQRDPGDDRRILALANFLGKKRSPFLAEEELVSAIFNHPETRSLRMALAELYEEMLNLDGAVRVYQDVARISTSQKVGNLARQRAAGLLLRMGDMSGAARMISEILTLEPANLDALLLQGKIAMLMQQFDQAITDFRTVLEQRPASLDVMALLVRAYVANGQSELAENGLRSAIAIDPTHVGVRLELVQLLMVQKRYEEALAEVQALLTSAPNELAALSNQVDIYVALGRWSEAEAAAKRMEEVRPDAVVGYAKLGELYVMQNLFTKAEEQFRTTLKRFPLDETVLDSLVRVIGVKEGIVAAQQFMEDFVQTYANHPTAYNLLGEIYGTQGEHTEAEAAFIKAYQLNPTWLAPYRNLAQLYAMRGEFEAVTQVYLNGLAIVPDNIQLAIWLADAYENLGKKEDAMLTYEGVLAKRDSTRIAAQRLAELLVEDAPAEDAARQALGLVAAFVNSGDADLLATAGWVYARCGEVADGIGLLRKAVEIAPNNFEAHYRLGAVYRDNGDLAAAKQALTAALEPRISFRGEEKAKAMLDEINAMLVEGKLLSDEKKGEE